GVLAVLSTTEADTRRLLKESRTWRAQRTQLRTAASPDRGVIRLSDQEERVAQLVLDGHTHKQIGSTLFISAKTVEHHVAHIRTKLGAGSRAELLASVRSYLGESG
ncbi:MAG: Transcriptional regulator, LuxR family, partial [Acidimicrobiaceae bacterium]